MDASGILGLLVNVATAAVDFGQFFRVRHFLDFTVAGGALQGGMGGGFEGGLIETWGYSGLALAGAWAGIVAAGAVLGTGWLRGLAAEAGGQQDRNGSEPG